MAWVLTTEVAEFVFLIDIVQTVIVVVGIWVHSYPGICAGGGTHGSQPGVSGVDVIVGSSVGVSVGGATLGTGVVSDVSGNGDAVAGIAVATVTAVGNGAVKVNRKEVGVGNTIEVTAVGTGVSCWLHRCWLFPFLSMIGISPPSEIARLKSVVRRISHR